MSTFKTFSKTLLLVVIGVIAAGCTTSGSSSRGDDGQSSVKIFGDIDAGIAHTR